MICFFFFRLLIIYFFFFFQAEDGIRDRTVTGVQTCALPISTRDAVVAYAESGLLAAGHDYDAGGMQLPFVVDMAANTFFAMASISISAFAMLTYANANLLMAYGTTRQRQIFGLPELQGRFLGTMCLSEPQAGSSLG